MTGRRVVTADDVLTAARAGRRELVVAPGDRVTPLARDVAQQHGVRLVEDAGQGSALKLTLGESFHGVAAIRVKGSTATSSGGTTKTTKASQDICTG